MKKLLTLILLTMLSVTSYALEGVEVGARVGMGWSPINSIYPGDRIADLNTVKTDALGRPSLDAGIFMDIYFLDWLSLTTGFNMSFMRGYKDNSIFFEGTTYNTIRDDISYDPYKVPDGEGNLGMTYHTFDLDILAKFHLKWWYGGVGLGLTINTAPRFTGDSTLWYPGDAMDGITQFSVYGNDSRMHVGMNLVFETGVAIPIHEGGSLQLGMRSSVDVVGLAIMSKFKPITERHTFGATDFTEYHNLSSQPFVVTPFSLGFTVGYAYRFGL